MWIITSPLKDTCISQLCFYLALPSFTSLYSTKLDCATMKEANRSQPKRKIQFTSTHPPHLTSHSSRPMGERFHSPRRWRNDPLLHSLRRCYDLLFLWRLGNTKDATRSPQLIYGIWKSGAPNVTSRKIVSSLCIRFRICARVHPEVCICICFAGNIGCRQKPGCNWSERAGRARGRCGCGRTNSSSGSSGKLYHPGLHRVHRILSIRFLVGIRFYSLAIT